MIVMELSLNRICSKSAAGYIGTVMPVRNALKSPDLFLSKVHFTALMVFMMDAKKDLPVDMSENFPYLGPYDRKIRRHPRFCPVGLLYCCIGHDGTIRGCPDQPVGYEEGSLRDRSFKDIWKGGFGTYRERRAVREDGRCRVCDESSNCAGGCWVMREHNIHCVRDYVWDVDK